MGVCIKGYMERVYLGRVKSLVMGGMFVWDEKVWELDWPGFYI